MENEAAAEGEEEAEDKEEDEGGGADRPIGGVGGAGGEARAIAMCAVDGTAYRDQ